MARPKIEPPKTRFAGKGSRSEAQREWLSVKPVYEQWFAVREKHATDEVLGAQLCDAIDEPARAKMYAKLEGKRKTFTRLLKYFSKKYEEDKVLALAESLREFRSMRRTGNVKLSEYLEQYDDLLQKCLKHGYKHTPMDGLDLIDSCDLSSDIHANTFERIIEKGGDVEAPKFKLVWKVLERVARAEQHRDRVQGGRGRGATKDGGSKDRGEKTERGAFVAGVRAALGKGAKGGGKGNRGVQRAIDKTFDKWKGGEKVTGALSKGKGKGKGTKSVCTFWPLGTCNRGGNCRFEHVGPSGGAAAAAPVPKVEHAVNTTFEFKRGDWMCPQCGAHNFASKTTCFRKDCGAKKPAGPAMPFKRE